jgi:hypothetical protein
VERFDALLANRQTGNLNQGGTANTAIGGKESEK